MDARGELLRVGLALLAGRGYGTVGLRDVAAEAGVTTGSIYHHFAGKEDLFRSAVEHHADLVVAGHRRMLAMSGTAADRLGAVVDSLVAGEAGEDWSRDLSVVLHTELRKRPGFDDVYRRLRRSFERVIRQPFADGVENGELCLPPGTTVDETAAVLQGGLVGLLQMHSQGALRVPLEPALRLHVSTVLASLSAPQGRVATPKSGGA